MQNLKIILLFYAFIAISAKPDEKSDGSSITDCRQCEQTLKENNLDSDLSQADSEEFKRDSNFRRTCLTDCDNRIRFRSDTSGLFEDRKKEADDRLIHRDVHRFKETKSVETEDVRPRKIPNDFDRNNNREREEFDNLYSEQIHSRAEDSNSRGMSKDVQRSRNLRGVKTEDYRQRIGDFHSRKMPTDLDLNDNRKSTKFDHLPRNAPTLLRTEESNSRAMPKDNYRSRDSRRAETEDFGPTTEDLRKRMEFIDNLSRREPIRGARAKDSNSRAMHKNVLTFRDSRRPQTEDVEQRTEDLHLRKMPKEYVTNENRKTEEFDNLSRRDSKLERAENGNFRAMPKDVHRTRDLRSAETEDFGPRTEALRKRTEFINNLSRRKPRGVDSTERLKRPSVPENTRQNRNSKGGETFDHLKQPDQPFVRTLENSYRGQNLRTRNSQEKFVRNEESNFLSKAEENGNKFQDRTKGEIYSNERANLVRTGFRTNIENLRGPQNFERVRNSRSVLEIDFPDRFGRDRAFKMSPNEGRRLEIREMNPEIK